MIEGNFVLAFTTGMVAAVNPCGFAMLPAYLGFFLGTETAERSTAARLSRALAVGGALTLGFLLVFGVVGTLLRNATDRIVDVSGWATLVIALVLIALGVAVTLGWRLPIATPKMAKGGRSGTFGSMFLFGVSYAVASIGCALPLFVGNVVLSSKRDGVLTGLINTVLYGLGMGLIITALTVSLALASGGLLKTLRTAMRFVDRAAGVVMVLAGLYLVVYAIEEIQVARGDLSGSAVTRRGNEIQSWFANLINDRDPVVLGIVLGALIGLCGLAVLATRRRAVHR